MLINARDLVLKKNVAGYQGTPIFGWDNVITSSNLTADSSDPDFPIENVADPSTALLWKSATAVEQYLTIAFENVTPVDYLGIARHNYGSAGIGVSAEALIDNAYTALTDEVIPPDDAPILIRMTELSPAGLRLRMRAGSAPPSAAVLYCGLLMPMERGLSIDQPHVPLDRGRFTEKVVGRSDSGNFLGSIITGGYFETTLTFSHLTEDWLRSTFDDFIEAAITRPFFYVERPNVYPRDVAYAWADDDIRPARNLQTGRYDVQIKLRGILR